MLGIPASSRTIPPFDAATVALAKTAAALTQSGSLVSVAGGGDTGLGGVEQTLAHPCLGCPLKHVAVSRCHFISKC